jgi:hypothetical protein
VVVTGEKVNVRVGPGTVYDILGAAGRDDRLPLVARTNGGDWYEVDYKDQRAWISASLVEANCEMSEIPVASTIPTIPTPTVTPTATVAPPRLKAPLDGAELRGDSLILLEWTWDGELGIDGVYSVRVWPEARGTNGYCVHDFYWEHGVRRGPIVEPWYLLDLTECSGNDLCWQVQPVWPKSPAGWETPVPSSETWCFSVDGGPEPTPCGCCGEWYCKCTC